MLKKAKTKNFVKKRPLSLVENVRVFGAWRVLKLSVALGAVR